MMFVGVNQTQGLVMFPRSIWSGGRRNKISSNANVLDRSLDATSRRAMSSLMYQDLKRVPLKEITPSGCVFQSRRKGDFLSAYVSQPTFEETNRRGFKTRSKEAESGSTPFLRQKDPSSVAINNEKALKAALSGDLSESSYLSSIMKKLDPGEKEKMAMAVNSYAAGFSAGKAREPFLKTFVSDGKDKDGKTGFWSKINHITSILVGLVFLALAAPMLGIRVRIKFGGTTNEISPEDVAVNFDDVKGCDEAKEELQEIVDFLKNPEKYSNLGGKLPKGCLLVGPPGTGKTLLARAVAGEATVPFFHSSGSEFDEVLVGQGAKRVRELFAAAKAKAPCVIFIDEIDSVGSTRTSSAYHPYANQTVNQLLSEMDGFLPNDGVIVLGATNRSTDLDKALLRPGRFDSQVTVEKPDMKGRKEILELYLGKIKHDFTVDVDILARRTMGFSGADLENLVNTAAIRAAVLGKDAVSMGEFEYSHDRRIMGSDWKSRVRPKEDMKITAYHEAGHTLVAYYTEQAMALHKVTIVAKGMSGGHTAMLPKNDHTHETKAELIAKCDVSMGGRVAEEFIFGKDKVTGGASSDLAAASSISEYMVTKLGMSEKVGLRVFPEPGRFDTPSKISPVLTETIDNEVERILNESYKRAMNIIKTHAKELHALADALLKYETLDAEQIKNVIEGKESSSLFQKSHNKNNAVNPIPKPSRPYVIDSSPDVIVTEKKL
ncbi:ATP-dependent zinc metalloprotease YME1L [Lepeophtheirus salmonis]|uniref:ATPdependent zinc metalloprotease YME1 homolog [Ceratitis capitata] n=1 Tax=Lepeophtheirus salmonis TaxID=72036 RepID=A0A0K2TUW6_LEPSM|nr:ATP-dependent zinc metalloprotease YME1L-like [Lepeophtheirus salmonis]